MPDTDTKDEDSTDVTPDQISTAKQQAVSKLFEDAFNARNNIQGLKNQKALILQQNAGLEAQFKAAEEAQATSRAAAKQATASAEGLHKEVGDHKKKLGELKSGLTDLGEAIKKLEAAKLPVDELTAAKEKLTTEIATEEKSVEEKTKSIEGHQAAAEEHTQAASKVLSGSDRAASALQQLTQIEGQIKFNETQQEQKQKDAEKAQAMSDTEWAEIPENRKAIKGLVSEAQKAAMEQEDKDAAANAKKSADLLVPDAEVKQLQGLLTAAKAAMQVAGRLPDGVEGAMDPEEARKKANDVDVQYTAIDKLRTKLAGEAAAADEGDQEAKDKFREESQKLRNMVRDFKTNFAGGLGVNLKKALPADADVSPLLDASKQLVGAKSSLLPLVGKENLRTTQAALGKFDIRWTSLKSAANDVKSTPGDAGADAWQQKIYSVLDQVAAFKRDMPLYKAKLDALAAATTKDQAVSLVAEVDKLGSG